MYQNKYVIDLLLSDWSIAIVVVDARETAHLKDVGYIRLSCELFNIVHTIKRIAS